MIVRKEYTKMVTRTMPNTIVRNGASNPLAKILGEAHEAFKDQFHFLPTQNFQEMLSDDSMFGAYVDILSEGLPAGDVAPFEQLIENQRQDLMSESLTSQIAPIAGLGMDTLRAMWPRTAIKDVYPVEVATIPAFSISWQQPYIRTKSGAKYYLPKAIINNQELVDKPKVYDSYIAVSGTTGNLLTLTVLDGVACSVAKSDSIDINIAISGVKMNLPDVAATPAGDKTKVEVACLIKRDLQGNFSGEVTGVAADDTVYTDTVFGSLNCETGEFKVVSLAGYVSDFKFRGWISQEANNNSISVSFDIKRKEIFIGTGSHFNTPMPIEWLKDLKALYNLDGTVEVIDLISKTISERLDIEGADFMDKSFEDMGAPHVGHFNCKPAAGCNVTPEEWRKQIRATIKWWARKIKSVSFYEDGYFVLFGNSMDVEIIPDVSWSFRADGDDSVQGGPSTYSFGVITGNHRIRVVSSDIIPEGYLRMVWIPTRQDQLTYKYYPYSFNIEKGYRDPNMPNVPSIMITKRHTFVEAIPIQARIMIENNIGDSFSSYAAL